MKYLHLGLKGLLTLGMAYSAFGNLTQSEMILESYTRLGYPHYLGYILGIAYVLGLIGIWQTTSPSVKQWAFAGFFFALTGATASHLLIGDTLSSIIAAVVFWVMIVAVYLLERKPAA